MGFIKPCRLGTINIFMKISSANAAALYFDQHLIGFDLRFVYFFKANISLTIIYCRFHISLRTLYTVD